MTELIMLGFPSKKAAEEARRRSAELDQEGAIDLEGAALAYRRDDGEVELVQPLRLAGEGAASGAIGGALIGLVVLAPLVAAAVGAAAGAAGAALSARILDARFVREVKAAVEPGRAALFLVGREGADVSAAIDALRPLSPRVIRTTLDEDSQQRLIAAFMGGSPESGPGAPASEVDGSGG